MSDRASAGVFNTQSEDAKVFNMNRESGERCEDMVVWMLNLECVQPMTMNQTGMQYAVEVSYCTDCCFTRSWTIEYTDEDRKL